MTAVVEPDKASSVDRFALGTGDILTRLRKIEGQVRGLQSMIDRHETCTAVLDQIASVQGALHAVAVGLVDAELRRCIAPRFPAAIDIDLEFQNVMQSVERLVRS